MLATIAIFLIRNCMLALMLAIGMRTTPAALRASWAERGLVIRALVVVELGVPVLALLTVSLLPVSMLAAQIIAIMAVCPGAPMLFLKLRDRAVVLVIIAAISVLAPISVACWLAVLDRVMTPGYTVGTGTLLYLTLVKQLLPLAVGVGVAALWPRLARPLARVLWVVFLIGLALAAVFLVVKGAPILWQISGWAYLAAAIVFLGSVAMGHVLGRPRRDDAQALAYIAVLGNPALGLAVISASAPDLRPAALMAAYLIIRALALVPYTVWMRRRPHEPAAIAPPDAALQPG